MSHSVFASSTLGSCPLAPASWKQKILREGGRGVFLKHKNVFEVLEWKEVRNKECWMLECDIWKLLGKCQPSSLQAMVPKRQNKFQPQRTEALLFWVFMVETGDSLPDPDSISPFQGCGGERSPGSIRFCLRTLNPIQHCRRCCNGYTGCMRAAPAWGVHGSWGNTLPKEKLCARNKARNN